MLPDFSLYGDFMNSNVKLSARIAMNGAGMKISLLFGLIMAIFLFFSFGNAVINRFLPQGEKSVLLITAMLMLILFILIICPLCLRFQIKLLLLAKGVKRAVKLNIGVLGGLKACEMCIRLFFIKLFWLCAFETIPVASAAVFVCGNLNKPVSLRASVAVFTGLSILAVAGFFFWLIFIQRYSKAMFYLASYKDFSAGEAIKESVRKTRDNLFDILLFKLSFLPWLVLCLGILPALYVIPYYKQSVTCLFLSR